MTCCMFPGQPLSRSVLPGDRTFAELAEECLAITGFDPRDAGDPAGGLSRNVCLQLFGVVASLHRYGELKEKNGPPDLIAEHSMGIYSALAASGSTTGRDALELAWRIGLLLARMGEKMEYALASVIGMTEEQLSPIVSKNGVYIANSNTSRHFLLAGTRKDIERTAAAASGAGAFSTAVFEADAPLHTPLVREIESELEQVVAGFTFRDPAIPLIDHLEQRPLTADRIPSFLVDELCLPVAWEATYRSLRERGVLKFYEAGTGQALTKFNRWIDSQP